MSPCTSTGSTSRSARSACSRSQTSADVRQVAGQVRPAGPASAGPACSGPARPASRTAPARPRPTSRAKPGTGLGSCQQPADRVQERAQGVPPLGPLGRGQPAGEGPAGEPAVDRVRAPVAYAAVQDQRHLDADVGLGPRPVQRPELADRRLRRLVPAPVEPEHPLLVEGEHLALPAGAEQPVPAGAELGQQGILARMVIDHLVHRAALPVGGPGGPGPVQLGQGQLAGHLGVELVGDQVDRSLGGVDVHVGQPEPALPAGPARCGPTGSWRAARCRGSGSSSRAR